jgi:hypothetical protein
VAQLLFQKMATDLTTVRFDLNSLPSVGTGFGVQGNLDLGGTGQGTNMIGQPYDPAWQQVAMGRAPVMVSFRLVYDFADIDTAVSNVQTLLQELDVPSPYKVQLPGESQAFFFDGFRAELPSMLRDEGDLHFYLANRSADPAGIPIQVPRLVYMYQAPVTVGPMTVGNDPSSGTHPRYITVNASGTMPTKAQVKIAPSGGAIVQTRISRRSYGDLPSWRSSWYVQAQNAATLTNAAIIASHDSTASGAGNNTVDLLTASDTTYGVRARWTINPAVTTATEGTFRVYARLKGVSNRTMTLGLVWAAGNVNPAVYPNPVVTLTYPATIQGWQMVDLGTIGAEHGLGTNYGFSLELWASSDATSGAFALDYLCLWPTGPTPAFRADQSCTTSIRGWRDGITVGAAAGQTYLGKVLLGGATASFSPGALTSGSVSGNDYKLTNNTANACGIAPVGGIAYGTGRLIAAVSVTTSGAQDTVNFNLVLRNVTDSSDATYSFTYGSTTTATTVTGAFDVVAGKNYQVQVRSQTGGTGGTIVVHSITTWLRVGLASGQEINVNGDYGFPTGRPASFATASGVFQNMLTQEGSYIDLIPGAQDLLFDWGDNPAVGYDVTDAREPLAESNLARTCDVTVVYYPRFAM